MIANIAIRLFLLSNSWTIWASLSTLQIRPSLCIFKRLILLLRSCILCSVLLSSLWLISSRNSTFLSVCFVQGSNFTFGWSFFMFFHFCGFAMVLSIKKIKILIYDFLYLIIWNSSSQLHLILKESSSQSSRKLMQSASSHRTSCLVRVSLSRNSVHFLLIFHIWIPVIHLHIQYFFIYCWVKE